MGDYSRSMDARLENQWDPQYLLLKLQRYQDERDRIDQRIKELNVELDSMFSAMETLVESANQWEYQSIRNETTQEVRGNEIIQNILHPKRGSDPDNYFHNLPNSTEIFKKLESDFEARGPIDDFLQDLSTQPLNAAFFTKATTVVNEFKIYLDTDKIPKPYWLAQACWNWLRGDRETPLQEEKDWIRGLEDEERVRHPSLSAFSDFGSRSTI